MLRPQMSLTSAHYLYNIIILQSQEKQLVLKIAISLVFYLCEPEVWFLGETMLSCVKVLGGKLVVRLELIASRCGMWSGSRCPSATSADEGRNPGHITALPTVLLEGLLSYIIDRDVMGKFPLDNSNEVSPLTYLASSISGLTH